MGPLTKPERADVSQERSRTFALALGVLFLALVTLALHASRYHPFIADDTLISLRYAERLLDGHGLTWNDGERVEGYSNLLWILLCAGAGAVGLDLVFASRALGFAALAAAIAALVRLHAPSSLRRSLPALAGGLAMALTGPFAVWSLAGLEQPLAAALIAWALVLLIPVLESQDLTDTPPRALLLPGLMLGMLCWTRPDGPLFTACACGVLVLVGRPRGAASRSAGWLALLPVCFVAVQILGRLAYYGDWVPNTAHSKLVFTTHRLTTGFEYWSQGVALLAGLAVPALAQAVLGLRRASVRARTLCWLVPLVAWSVYVIVIGGDIFPGRRHLVVVVVLMAFLAADLWAGWQLRETSTTRSRALPWVAAFLSLAILGAMQWSLDRTNRLARREVPWSLQGEALGRSLGRAFATEQPLMAVTMAGALPYYSRLPALDMLGLNDRYLARNPPENLGQGRIGHELGDGRYFMERQPDLIVFCGPSGGAKACARGGREMQRMQRFAREYQLVTWIAHDPASTAAQIYVRRDSERIGVQVDSDGVTGAIPGYLFRGAASSTVTVDEEGHPGLLVRKGEPVRYAGLRLPAGRYRASALASEGDGGAGAAQRLELAVRASGTGGLLGRDRGAVVFEVNDRPVDLEITEPEGIAHLLRVVLERSTPPATPLPRRAPL